MIPHKGLIIRQPWIELILSGEKVWEMRSKPTSVRGRVALIEAGTGLITGECWIVHSSKMPITDKEMEQHKDFHRVEDFSLLKKWCYPWEIKFARRYKEPIPYVHPKGAVIWVDLSKQDYRHEL